MRGLTHVAKVFPLTASGKGQLHMSDPLDDLWYCHVEPMYRRDLIVMDAALANQYVGLGIAEPLLKSGWKVEVYYLKGLGPGQLLGTFHVQDPDIVAAPVRGGSATHHQEVRLTKIISKNEYG